MRTTFGVAPGDHDASATGREFAGGSGAYSARRAGDDGGLAAHAMHVHLHRSRRQFLAAVSAVDGEPGAPAPSSPRRSQEVSA